MMLKGMNARNPEFRKIIQPYTGKYTAVDLDKNFYEKIPLSQRDIDVVRSGLADGIAP
jgi:hypothetical protein